MSTAESADNVDNLGEIMRQLFACRDALDDVYRQVAGKCPDGVEPMTWARVRLLMEGDR